MSDEVDEMQGNKTPGDFQHARTCPGCDEDSISQSYTVGEMMFGSDEEFRYLECGECRTLRLENVPEDLGAYYPRVYYSVADDPQTILGRAGVRSIIKAVGRSALGGSGRVASAVATTVRRREVQTLLSIYSSIRACGLRARSAARILDVGAGSGMLVYAMSIAGFGRVEGIDPFADGDRTFDTNATIRAVDLAGLPTTEHWDLIMFNHSFEHVPDPRADLVAAARLLAPGGTILVRMPTVSSWAWEHYGVNWVQLDAPRHLSLFSRKGMASLVASVGLEIREIRDDSSAFQFWGSEQVLRGIALDAANSHMVNEKRSPFSAGQIAQWSKRADGLNAEGMGDQAAWILGRPDVM